MEETETRRSGEALLHYTSALRCCFREDSELNELFVCLNDESSLLPAHEHSSHHIHGNCNKSAATPFAPLICQLSIGTNTISKQIQ